MKLNTGQAHSTIQLLLTDKEIVKKIGKPLAKKMLTASKKEYTAERKAGIMSIATQTPLQTNILAYLDGIQGYKPEFI